MRKTTLFFIAALLFNTFSHAQTATDTWKLVFEENFDVAGEPNSQYWSYCPRRTSDWNKYLVMNNPQTVRVENGNLIVSAIKNPDTATDNVPFLTGGIKTEGKFSITYGKVEVRAKFNNGQGAWPAIWMMPEDGSAGWPAAGEIDIMEHLNNDNFIYQTIHSYYASNKPYGMANKNPQDHGKPAINKDDFNVYGVEWYPNRLDFTINGAVTFTYPRLYPDVEWQWPFNKKFYLILNQAAGGSWAGAVNETALPFKMEVDWVKMYELNADYPYSTPVWTGNKPQDDAHWGSTYLNKVTSNGTINAVNYTAEKRPDSYYNLYPDTLKVNAGTDFSIQLKAFSLGAYNTNTVLQDLRYTCCYVYADFDGDKSFEIAQARIGNQPPTNGVGGNMEVMDVTAQFSAPAVTENKNGRIRVVYDNAWKNRKLANESVFEGLVYDFNVKFITSGGASVNSTTFQPTVFRVGNTITFKDLKTSKTTIRVFNFLGKEISAAQISSNDYVMNVPAGFCIVNVQNADGEVFVKKM